MKKSVKRIIYIVLLVAMSLTMFSCKKKVKHKWIEQGSDPNPQKVEPGVHPERGSDSEAIPIISIPILYPTGNDANGTSQYIKYFYDLEELTADNVDTAMKEIGLISDTSVFCDLVIESVNDIENAPSAGPGASGTKLTKKGTVQYVVLDSNLINENDENVKKKKNQEGLVTKKDIEHCVEQTFEETFQLASCDFEMVSMDVYKKKHEKEK